MPVYKCQNCGAVLEISNDDDVVVCSYCGTAQSFRETRQDPDMISTWHDNLMKRAKMALSNYLISLLTFISKIPSMFFPEIFLHLSQ